MEPENNMKVKDQFSKTVFFSSNFLMEVGGDTCVVFKQIQAMGL